MEGLPGIDGFRLLEELGSGAMGRVYSAEVVGEFHGLERGKRAALKIINPELIDDPHGRARFDREMKVGISLKDPHLMRMYGEGRTDDGIPFVAMEMLDGRPLSEVIRTAGGPLPVPFAVEIGLGISRGLKALHDLNIVHRDLKPANVMVLPDGSVKLMDFGLARLLELSSMLTQAGSFLGTFQYSSPEQFGGRTGVPSDLWSLGVILYEMLTGRHPFACDTLPEVLAAIQSRHPMPPESANPNLPHGLCCIVNRLLEKNISLRLASADEVIAALEERPGPALREFLIGAGERRDKKRERMEAVLPFATHFQGRKTEMEAIAEKLFDPEVTAVSVTGIRGLGKSALIAEAAKRIRDRFPSGGLYYDVRKDSLTWHGLAERIFNEIGYDAGGQLIEDALAQALSVNHCLLVIDSAESFETDDWEGVSRLFGLIEKRRAQGGFDAFPTAVLFGARAVPVMRFGLLIEEVALEGLSPAEGAELLRRLTRDQGPEQWDSVEERKWVSGRVGGHPEMLRLIANQVRRQDYRIVKRGISSMRGKLLKRMEEVMDWSVERLGAEGRALIPYFACCPGLCFEFGELAAAAGFDADSLEFEEGMDQLQYSAGLIHWDHVRQVYGFHASLFEWARRRLDDPAVSHRLVTLLDRRGILDAHGKVAEYWESRFGEMPDEPRSPRDMKPILSAIEHRIRRGEARLAHGHFATWRFRTALGGEKGDEVRQLLNRFGLFSESLRIARQIAAVTDRETDPDDWAVARNSLGVTLIFQRTGDRARHITEAVSSFEQSLEVIDRNTEPQRWAGTMRNLGIAWSRLPTGNISANLEKSIHCFEHALEILSVEEAPFEWALTNHGLGNAWRAMPTGGRAENIKRAIDCFEKVESVITRESAPFEWARLMNNLGNAWWSMISGDFTENSRRAIRYYSQALTVHTRQAAPFEWARTMNNLGLVWSFLPGGDRKENLEKAISYFKEALGVRTRQAAPSEWAMTMNNLATAWLLLPGDERDKNLLESIDCSRKALEVYTRSEDPLNWARAMSNIGEAWSGMQGGERESNLEKAAECCRQALEVRMRESAPTAWASTTVNLGVILREMASVDPARSLEDALGHIRTALEVYSRGEFPVRWADTCCELGLTWLVAAERAGKEGAVREALEMAAGCFDDALEELTPDGHPHLHKTAQNSLARARKWLETGRDPGGGTT